MYRRNILTRLIECMEHSPVVLLLGARQTGKTTLVKAVSERYSHSYVTLDDMFVQGAAITDPVGFVQSLSKPVIIDEVQRAPKIFLPVKKDVDENRLSGRYLFTGSANPLVLPKLGDSLAGRMQLINLWPLSQGELRDRKEDFVDRIFSDESLDYSECRITKQELLSVVFRGGYPALQSLSTEVQRYDWCNGYLSTLIQKDITDLAKIENIHAIPNLLKILASRCGSTLNERALSRDIGLPFTTLRRYLQLLHNLFFIVTLPGWFRNVEKRIVKSPKIYFVDTAILLHILGFDEKRLVDNPKLFGHVVENFVIGEILKQLSWSSSIVQSYHFRLHDGGMEVDLVLENRAGQVVGIEVKSSETVVADDFKSLKELQKTVGKDFVRGILLYTGNKQGSFGSNLDAIPISALWSYTNLQN